jgi:hypothetical protein
MDAGCRWTSRSKDTRPSRKFGVAQRYDCRRSESTSEECHFSDCLASLDTSNPGVAAIGGLYGYGETSCRNNIEGVSDLILPKQGLSAGQTYPLELTFERCKRLCIECIQKCCGRPPRSRTLGLVLNAGAHGSARC